MSKLTIKQVEKVLGISYPTALSMAQDIGTMHSSNGGPGRWMVDADHIRSILEGELEVTYAKLGRLNEIVNE